MLTADYELRDPLKLAAAKDPDLLLTELFDDSVTLYQVRPGAKIHVEHFCSAFKHWQDAPQPIAARLSELPHKDLCKTCSSWAQFSKLRRAWSAPPTLDVRGPRQVLCAVVITGAGLDSPTSEWIRLESVALAALETASAPLPDPAARKVFFTLPTGVADWFRRAFVYDTLIEVGPLEENDTQETLETAAALWDAEEYGYAEDKFPLAVPAEALRAARAALATA